MNTLEKLLDLLKTSELVDMTHVLEEGIPHWPTQPGVKFETGMNYVEDGSYWRGVSFCEHSGTHLDALSHFFQDAEDVDEIPVERLMGRGVNIDVTHLLEKQVTTVEDVMRFEAANGPLREGDLVFFRFGWDKKWKIGDEGRAFMENWPGISEETAKYLRAKKVSAVGTDASALDAFGTANPSHRVLLGNGINIIENVNKLEVLPPFFGVIGLPCRFKHGSGSTLRLIALVDRQSEA